MLGEQSGKAHGKGDWSEHGTRLLEADERNEEHGGDAGASILRNDRFVYANNREGSIDGDMKQSRWHGAESTAQITTLPTASESLSYGNSVQKGECIIHYTKVIV